MLLLMMIQRDKQEASTSVIIRSSDQQQQQQHAAKIARSWSICTMLTRVGGGAGCEPFAALPRGCGSLRAHFLLGICLAVF